MPRANSYLTILRSRFSRLGFAGGRRLFPWRSILLLIFLIFAGLFIGRALLSGEDARVLARLLAVQQSDRELPVSQPPPAAPLQLASLFPANFFAAARVPPVFSASSQGAPVEVYLTIDPAIQQRLSGLMRRYRPLAAAGVVLDPASGDVLAMATYHHPGRPLPPALAPGGDNLCLFAGFPAASLIKIVSAAAALERKGYTAAKTLPVSGRFHTLYKHQLGLKKPRFRSQPISLEKAFSLSINPFFGQLGIRILSERDLFVTARNFLFNVPLKFDLPVGVSRLLVPRDDYARAELACGFNTATTISPLHAALIASLPAGDGRMMRPRLVRRVVGPRDDLLYREPPPTVLARPLSRHSLEQLRRLMRATVRYGTARKSFSHLRRVRGWRQWELGGKTGSIDLPRREGRCEWFAGYGLAGERRVAVALVLVHGERRTISSAYVAAEMIKKVFRSPRPRQVAGLVEK